MTIVYYVSGHGFGHAVRSVEVIRELAKLGTGLPLIVRTKAPAFLFRDTICAVSPDAPYLDAGAVERDIFNIDGAATVDRLVELNANATSIVESESNWLRTQNPSIVIADIPWLAGDISQECDAPCVGISNFLWNWIYEPFLHQHEQGETITKLITESYNRFDAILRLPLSHEMNLEIPVNDVPFVAARGQGDNSEIHKRTGVDPLDSRRRILVCLRDLSSLNALTDFSERNRNFMFVVIGKTRNESASNVHYLELDKSLTVADLVAWSDIVLAKPGYGIMSTCAVNGSRLLCVPRTGFREDEVLIDQGRQLFPVRVIPFEDFEHGNWDSDIQHLLDSKVPEACPDSNGAQACAEAISRFL
jgi:hypothetical protein